VEGASFFRKKEGKGFDKDKQQSHGGGERGARKKIVQAKDGKGRRPWGISFQTGGESLKKGRKFPLSKGGSAEL